LQKDCRGVELNHGRHATTNTVVHGEP
jgi:hypothetical protein